MSTLTGGTLNLVKPALTDDHKVTIGTDLPANFQKIDDAVSAHLAETVYKVGSFTRDLSLESGNLSITGLGFKPKAIILFAADSSSAHKMSIGFSDGTNNMMLADYGNGNPGVWYAYGPRAFWILVDGSSYVTGTISFDSDGFTLALTKTGSPTGTVTVGYLAMSHY